MNSLKQFLLAIAAIVALSFLFRKHLCQYFCDPCVETKALVPNPTIEFNVPNANFSVTPHAVPGATSVKLDVFDKMGALVVSHTPTIGTAQNIMATQAQRPLQLVFTYLAGAGNTVATDSLAIDDRQNGGVPVMDIIIAVHSGNQQSCPNFNTPVTVTPITTTRYKFSWDPTKIYKIVLNHGSPATDLIMKTELNGVTGCYKAVLWRKDEYSCLSTQPAMANDPDSTTGKITTSAGDVKLTGNDSCDGATAREIFMKFSSAGSVTVFSN